MNRVSGAQLRAFAVVLMCPVEQVEDDYLAFCQRRCWGDGDAGFEPASPVLCSSDFMTPDEVRKLMCVPIDCGDPAGIMPPFGPKFWLVDEPAKPVKPPRRSPFWKRLSGSATA